MLPQSAKSHATSTLNYNLSSISTPLTAVDCQSHLLWSFTVCSEPRMRTFKRVVQWINHCIWFWLCWRLKAGIQWLRQWALQQ